MKTLTEIRQQNLKAISEGFKSQRAFADAIDASPGYVSQLIVGNCHFGEKAARKIEKMLNKSVGWLDRNHDFDDSYRTAIIDGERNNNQNIVGNNHVNEINERRTVPVIALADAGELVDTGYAQVPKKKVQRNIICPKEHGKDTFAFTVTHDSMTSLHPGQQSYPVGTVIYIDPDVLVSDGCKVVVRNGESITFRVYREDVGKRWLVPINTMYEKQELTQAMEILGVGIFAGMDI